MRGIRARESGNGGRAPSTAGAVPSRARFIWGLKAGAHAVDSAEGKNGYAEAEIDTQWHLSIWYAAARCYRRRAIDTDHLRFLPTG